MRMYACEASCMLGNPTRAMEYLEVRGEDELSSGDGVGGAG